MTYEVVKASNIALSTRRRDLVGAGLQEVMCERAGALRTGHTVEDSEASLITCSLVLQRQFREVCEVIQDGRNVVSRRRGRHDGGQDRGRP